jgi:hypothetical protein
MNKTIRILLVVLTVIAALAYAMHSTHLEGMMRRLHGGA